MQLNSVDLFSGIGGMQHGLRGICRPLLYCEIDEFAQRVLTKNMRTKKLPKAPIVDDVRDVDAIMHIIGKQHVHVVISTSSCQGFSLAGSHGGLQHHESKIIAAALQVIELIRPAIVFMENVPGILNVNNGQDFAWLQHYMNRLDYEVTFGIFSANQVGALHMRRRWYAVFKHRTRQLPAGWQRLMKPLRRFHWSLSRFTADHLVPRDNITNNRLHVLGNAVVPDCARTAFITLMMNHPVEPIKYSKNILDITLKANVFDGFPHDYDELTIRRFPTPRALQLGACRKITYRCSQDLGTVLRFWDESRGDRSAKTNPQFVEFLMGFPRDWTKLN